MEDTDHRMGWVVFSLFVWLHLAQTIFPLPLPRSVDIKNHATEAVENSNSLVKKGVEPDKYTQMSNEEWESGFTKYYWLTWVSNSILLFTGLVSTLLLYKNHRLWPFVIAFLSIITMSITIPPVLKMVGIPESFMGSVNFWIKAISDHDFYFVNSLYTVFIWPFYLIPLLGLSVHEFYNRLCRSD